MTLAPVEKIALATDGSPASREAIEFAFDLARRYRAQLTIVAISPLVPVFVGTSGSFAPAELPPSQLPYYRALVDELTARAKEEGIAATGLSTEGVVVDEILAFLEGHPQDLLVIGSRGLSRGKRFLLGSVSSAVVQAARCPVLVVHPRSSSPST